MMKMDKSNDQQREMRIEYIPMGKIDIPFGQQKFGNPTARVASIQRVGLLQPIVVTPRRNHYRVLVGLDLCHACALLGWATIPAIVLSVDDQLAKLIAIDAKLIREELTPSQRGELRRRRREISRAISRQNKHRQGPKQAQRKETHSGASAPATDTPSKTAPTSGTVQPPVPSDINDHTKEGRGKGRSANLAPRGSRAPRAFIPRLIKSLLGIQDTQQSPPAPTNHRPKHLAQGSARGGKVGHKMAARQTTPARSRDGGETNRQKGRGIA